MQDFRQRAEKLGMPLSDTQIAQLDLYVLDLQKYNEHTNLVSNADRNLLWENHILDSLSVAAIARDSIADGGDLIDIGSGAGFPGLVIAIVIDNLRVSLVDSVGKKTKFLQEAISNLGLVDRVEAITARAEDLAHEREFRGSYDLATARAVGNFDLTCELTLPFLKNGGKLLSQRSKNQLDAEEIMESAAVALLGGGKPLVVMPDLEALGRDLRIIIIEKMKPSPRDYPRVAAQLKKPILEL